MIFHCFLSTGTSLTWNFWRKSRSFLEGSSLEIIFRQIGSLALRKLGSSSGLGESFRPLYLPVSRLPHPSLNGYRTRLNNIYNTSTMDCKKVAETVYELAASEDPLGPLVKEALDVIDAALDTHG